MYACINVYLHHQVEEMRTARKLLVKKREKESGGQTEVQKPKFALDDDDDEDDEDEDDDDELDWRKKGT